MTDKLEDKLEEVRRKIHDDVDRAHQDRYTRKMCFPGYKLIEHICDLVEIEQQLGNHKKALALLAFPLEFVYENKREMIKNRIKDDTDQTRQRVTRLGIDLALHCNDLEQVLDIYEYGVIKFTKEDRNNVQRIGIEELSDPVRTARIIERTDALRAARILAEAKLYEQAVEIHKTHGRKYGSYNGWVDFFVRLYTRDLKDLGGAIDVYLTSKNRHDHAKAVKVYEEELNDYIGAAVIAYERKLLDDYRQNLQRFISAGNFDAELQIYKKTGQHDIGIERAVEVGNTEMAQVFVKLRKAHIAAELEKTKYQQTLGQAQAIAWREYGKTPCG